MNIRMKGRQVTLLMTLLMSHPCEGEEDTFGQPRCWCIKFGVLTSVQPQTGGSYLLSRTS